ncbi:Thioredoxin [hydrothermal vent metagenome]|uniref:Thioredoxin n=1 Tax=hydrothermal vent metagenome TaxID=652676 RepID=A0A3B0SWA8_9ZZZZ
MASVTEICRFRSRLRKDVFLDTGTRYADPPNRSEIALNDIAQKPVFIYVGDPMCSWCWGFAPTLDQLVDRFGISMETVVGGLRPGPNAEVLDDRMRTYLLDHWQHVAESTGQPFDKTGLDRQDWRYDTELPAIATVGMRLQHPDQVFRFFKRLQQAFYAEAIDITDIAVYPALLAGFEIDVDRFVENLGSQEWKRAAWDDFSRSRGLDIQGFPSLLVQIGTQLTIVTRGYAPYDKLEPTLTQWFTDQDILTADGEACAVDGSNC